MNEVQIDEEQLKERASQLCEELDLLQRRADELQVEINAKRTELRRLVSASEALHVSLHAPDLQPIINDEASAHPVASSELRSCIGRSTNIQFDSENDPEIIRQALSIGMTGLVRPEEIHAPIFYWLRHAFRSSDPVSLEALSKKEDFRLTTLRQKAMELLYKFEFSVSPFEWNPSNETLHRRSGTYPAFEPQNDDIGRLLEHLLSEWCKGCGYDVPEEDILRCFNPQLLKAAEILLERAKSKQLEPLQWYDLYSQCVTVNRFERQKSDSNFVSKVTSIFPETYHAMDYRKDSVALTEEQYERFVREMEEAATSSQ